MIIQNFLNFLSFKKYLQFLVLSIPVLLITGPFLPDLFYKCLMLGFIINFFPFFFSGNFFNNWLSILYFYPLGFLLKIKVTP